MNGDEQLGIRLPDRSAVKVMLTASTEVRDGQNFYRDQNSSTSRHVKRFTCCSVDQGECGGQDERLESYWGIECNRC